MPRKRDSPYSVIERIPRPSISPYYLPGTPNHFGFPLALVLVIERREGLARLRHEGVVLHPLARSISIFWR